MTRFIAAVVLFYLPPGWPFPNQIPPILCQLFS